MGRKERGLTLVDITISTAILVIIVGVAYPGFKIANDTISTSGIRDRLERSGDRILKRLLSEARSGRIISVDDNGPNPSMVVRQPMTGVDLSEIDQSGGVPWAGTDQVARYRELETVLESDVNHDINKDGDKSDEFSLGVIELTADELADGFRPIVQRAAVVRALPNMNGDVNGDEIGDPMFELDAVNRRLTINIYLVGRDGNGRFLSTDVHGSVRLRNVQE